jgi:putative membrane protein
MKHLLSKTEEADVAARVAAAELGTAGEIVILVAERSGPYERQRAAISFALTLLLAVLLHELVHDIPALWILCAQAPVFLLIWWISGHPSLTRWLVPEAVRREAVKTRAKQLFIDQGLTETRERSGVLLYLSEAEHAVELLADRGIHERVGTEEWQRTVDSVVRAIHEGHAAQGIIGAVDAIGASLARHFPPAKDDTNELPDGLRRV